MVACGRHEKGAPPTHANDGGSAQQKTGSTGLMTSISDQDQLAKAHFILDVIISLGGKKVERQLVETPAPMRRKTARGPHRRRRTQSQHCDRRGEVPLRV